MKTIWKYQLRAIDDPQEFSIPGWGGVAFVANQDGFANTVMVWCHVDTEKPNYKARFPVTKGEAGRGQKRRGGVWLGAVSQGPVWPGDGLVW